MASITSEIASSSFSSSLPKWEYDVFLSFKGEDTHNNFTDHLYAALDQKGIWTFRDEERLERGTTISTELLNAIEKSKFAIIVLSRNYASSSWCLDELVKIVECKEKTRLTILPVFHGVDPSDVRHQMGSFAEAFAKHELIKNEEKLQSWRAALTQVANLSGWDTRNKKESTIIEEIARKLIGDMHYSYSGVYEDLVGIQSRVEELENLCLRMGLNDVHFIGIWGMGGIGKTTIAQVLYDRICCHFAGSSFLANVREKSGNGGLVTLQKQLLSEVLCEKNIDIWNVQWGINLIRTRLRHKRVLVILDDVDQDEQLEALASKRSWFGEGSVIIIITRDQSVLIRHEVAEQNIYKAKELDKDEALKLFSLKAFKQDNPLEGYEALSEKFIYYAQGLPLALKVLGSFMFDKNLDAWEFELGKLKESPGWEILDVLRISFDGLQRTEQKIFLDIACFFKGMTKDRVANLLQTHYKPYIEIDVLKEKSLVIISNGTLGMPNLIQELAKEIVRCESSDELGRRSRLWLKEDILQILKDNTGTEKVEGIFINTPSKEEDLNIEEKVEDLNAETFSKMRNLRLLKICNVGLPQGLNSLSSDLRLMDWPECPLKFMPKDFYPSKLVELIMPRSLIKQLWEGNWSLKWLRIIDLRDSRELIVTLDFARVPNLKELILKGCTNLSKIHASLGDLKHLILLDLNNCKCLESLPDKISCASLEIFNLSGCSMLKKFPEIVGNMSRLLVLHLDETAIEDLPLSMEQLTGLIKLDLKNCKKLSSLPRVIFSLASLNTLTLSGCSKLHKMQENLGNLKGLKELNMSGTGIRDLPLSMEQLTGLIKLDLTNCKNLSSLPVAICSLTSLKTLTLSCLKLDSIPMNLGNLKGLEELDISGTTIIEPPSSIFCLKNLKILSFQGCKWSCKKPLNFQLMTKTPDLKGLVLPSLSGLCLLTRLNIRNCNLQAIPSDIGYLSSLEELDLSGNNFVFIPQSINQLSKLREFWVENCKSLQLLPELQLMSPYNKVWANGCTSLESLLPVKMKEKSRSRTRSSLYLLNCFQFVENQGCCDLFTTMLRKYFQEMCYQESTIKGQFDVFLPGSEVPNWFRHQSVGASINLEVPPYLFKQFRGIALCAVFRPHQHRRRFHELLVCSFKANGIDFTVHPFVNFSEEFDRVESDHRWFMYLFPDFFKSDHPRATEFLHQIVDGSSCQLEIVFKPNYLGMMEIKKCGAHMVYDEEMEDLKQSMDQTKCSIIPYNEGVDHFEEDVKIKRSRDDENGASGECSSTHMPSEIASSSSLPKWEYDVFLSFRGEDTCNNFTDHLYAALDQKGIRTFRDDERLERGKSISTELLNAIEKSKFAIIVLSRNYASSSWCLDELVKIVDCKEETRLTILPVFYGVDPSEVRKQTGSFAEAFAKHEELIKNEVKLQSWRAALSQVANLSGWDARNKQESTIIKEIIREILGDLNSSYSYVHKDLVGMKSRVEEMEDLCSSVGLNDVRFIGIWGMGGVGKTTLAQVLYEKIHSHFDGSSFLENVREKCGNGGLVTLQKQLLSDVLFESNIDILGAQQGINVIMKRLCCKSVLVILDDVDQLEQLEMLVGKRSWFGQGSVIIITTRDQHLLRRHAVAEKEIYKARLLNDDEALKLFSMKAFKQDYPSEGYELPSQMVIYYAQGLPLALKILGSFLFGRNLDAWESLLGRLQECPESKILDVLQISYDGLGRTEKNIFLDIACFFKGMTKDRVANILQSRCYRPYIDIDVLMEKSLITISNGTLWMHDLLQELGKEIVRRESPNEPGERSRLWLKEHIHHVLIDNAGTVKVEGIFLNSSPNKEDNVEVNFEAFSKMTKLRLLNIDNVQLPQGLSFLSSELRLMNWLGYPLKFMPGNFHPKNLVELIMPHSHIKQLWEGVWSLEWLRIIDLSDSRELIMTLDFARVPNLEKLILKGCTKLSKIHASLGDLKHLILLDLNGCTCLKSLPCKINLKSLEIFILSSCSKLKKFPEIVGNMSRLLELYLDGTAIEDLPSSLEQLIGLIKLDLTNCKNLSSLPETICSLTSLKTLTLSGCLKLDNMPMNLGNLEGLEELDVSGTAIREPPFSICCLKNLKILSFQGCNGLSWKKPLNFLLMKKTPDLMGLVLLSVSGLSSLIRLNIRKCNLQAIPSDIGCLSSLKELDLSENNFVVIPQSINQLSKLKKFWVENCKSLQLLPEVGLMCPGIEVWANGCTSLKYLPPVKMKDDSDFCLYLLNCFQLVENKGGCDLFSTMLREYFQESTNGAFDVDIPGSEVPIWFRHRSVGASVNLEVPSYLFKQFRGIALCAVFGPHQHRPPKHLSYDHFLGCYFKANGNYISVLPCEHSLERFDMVESDHRWFMYYNPIFFKSYFLKGFLQIADGSSCKLEIEFKCQDPRIEIKKCGAHMVFEEEMKDLKESIGQIECSSGSSSIIPYNEGVDVDHFEKDIKIKRSRDDENGGSGEGSSTRIPHPETKRVRRFGNSSTQDNSEKVSEDSQ